MTSQIAHRNETLWRTTLSAAFSGDTETLNACVQAGMMVHIPGESVIAGDTPIITYLTRLFELAGADAEVDVEAVLANDDRVVAIYKVTGQRGERRLSYRALNVYHVRDGRLAEAWVNPKDIDAFNRFFALTGSDTAT
jgi:ketosteroid isomerase-like protein